MKTNETSRKAMAFLLLICSYALLLLNTGFCFLYRTSTAGVAMAVAGLALSSVLFVTALLLAVQYKWGTKYSYTPIV